MPAVRSQPPGTITSAACSHSDWPLADVPCALIVYVAARQLEQAGAVLVGQEKTWYPCRGECGLVLPRFRSAGLAPGGGPHDSAGTVDLCCASLEMSTERHSRWT
jgi:hypothetical protein